MPTEQQKKKTGQTLQQTAQNVGDPSNMARIVGTAGEGFADFLSKAYEYMVPQSVEELAMEGSPAGKAIGTAIGMIPPKYIRPLVERLKARISTHAYPEQIPFDTAQRGIIERQIDDYPAVSAHIDMINELSPRLVKQGYGGVYFNGVRTIEPGVPIRGHMDLEPEIKQILRRPKDPGGIGGYMELDPHLEDPKFKDVLRHEYNHAAQEIQKKLPQLQEWTNDIDYYARPEEIGSRISERRGQWIRGGRQGSFSYPKALESELNLLENQYALNPEKYPSLNESIMYMNEQLKPKGLHIVADIPGNMLNVPASIAPRRRFRVERVVLGK